MAGRKYSNQSSGMKRIKKNNATASMTEAVRDQANNSPLGAYSPRGAIIKGVQWLTSRGDSEGSRARRHGAKVSDIKKSRKP
tara:strand:- start:12 stop:257 length:246 start_codon:yes stop_codon:yes gene_type:complete